MSRKDQRIELPDGRQLGYDDLGSPDAPAIFYFHGAPSSRVDLGLFGSEELAEGLGVRIIASDRPGMGLSTFQPHRRVSDWPADVSALADALELQHFAVLSFSGGAPYALACALAIPERLTAVGVVSSSGLFENPALTEGVNRNNLKFTYLARDRPRLSRLAFRIMGAMARYAPGRLVAQVMAAFPEPDRAVMARPEVSDAFVATVREALRQGPRGAQLDTALMVSPWEFRPEEIGMRVHLWHGEVDQNAPLAVGRYLADAMPNSERHFYAGEGHLSLIVNHAEEILSVVVPGVNK